MARKLGHTTNSGLTAADNLTAAYTDGEPTPIKLAPAWRQAVHRWPVIAIALLWAVPVLLTHSALGVEAADDQVTVQSSLKENHSNASALNWPQWRGPLRDGQAFQQNWPSSLSSSSLVQKWRVELGESYSGPLLVENRIFVTESVDKQAERVRALDRATGQELWRVEWTGAMTVPFFAASNGSWIRSTPTYADGRLFVGGMRDLLVCLDASNGNELWRVDFLEQFKSELPAFGMVCSPLVDGDYLYVQAGGGLAKLHCATGKVLWRGLNDGGGMNGSAFSSPMIATLCGQRQLLVQTRTTLCGVNLETGEKYWSFDVPAFRGMNILTPITYGDAVFTSSYGGKSFLIDVKKENGQWQASERWSYKAEGYMSTPVVVDHYVYLHLRNQRVTCIDLNTGQSTWTSRPFGKYWSMIANQDRIVALDQKGELLLLRANPQEFELLERREISEQETWAHLAIAGGDVAVRELRAITLYEWK